MTSPRRREDSEEQDYSRLRGGISPLNGHTKWVVATAGTIGVTLLLTLAARDRNGIDKDQARQDTEIASLRSAVTNMATAQAGMAANIQAIKESVERIESRQVRRRE